jgi:aminoglycoside 6'-N-acetyltransferase
MISGSLRYDWRNRPLKHRCSAMSASNIHLRPAAPSDLALLRYWDTKPHVLAATGGVANWDWEAELAHGPDGRELLIAEIDGRPIGFMQIMDPARDETHYWGEVEPGLRALDIWIGEEADLGRGYGTQMMRLAIEKSFAEAGVNAVLLDPLASNTRAHRFYERLGFRAVERRMFGHDDCLVYRLEREVWQARNPPPLMHRPGGK